MSSSRVGRRFMTCGVIAVAVMLASTEVAGASVAAVPDSTAGVTGTVYAVAQVGNRTIIGGEFSAVGGLPRRNAAAIRSDGTVDPAFVPDPDGVVYAVSGSGDGTTVFLGGTFANAGGAARSNLAAVDSTTGAALAGWNVPANSDVFALTRSGDSLYVGGRFTAIGTSTRRRLARVNISSGVVETAFNPWPNWTVKGVAVSADGGRVYAVGGFTEIGTQARRGAAELLATNGTATAFNPAQGGVALAVAVTPDGSRFFFSTTDNRLRAYAPAVSNNPVWTVQSSGDTQAIAASATEVYFGGHFGQLWGTGPRTRRAVIASVLVGDGTVTSWNPGANGTMGVWAAAVTPTSLLVGGDFTRIGGRNRAGFARFTGTP